MKGILGFIQTLNFKDNVQSLTPCTIYNLKTHNDQQQLDLHVPLGFFLHLGTRFLRVHFGLKSSVVPGSSAMHGFNKELKPRF